MYVKTDPLTLYLHTAARHFLKSWLQAASSESPFNLQEENTKLYFLYQRTPNTQRVNSKCNLSSISHISLKSIITEALTRKSFLCIVWGLWYKMSPLNTEDQDYSTGFGTLTLPLSLPLIVRHTEKIPSCFEDFNIFRTAAQMQLKFFIKNFDQYDFLLPPTNRVLSGLRSKPRLSITFLGNSLRISSHPRWWNITQTSTTTQSANSKPQGTLMKGDSPPLMYVEIHSYWVSRGD